jgi:hypothetical protein
MSLASRIWRRCLACVCSSAPFLSASRYQAENVHLLLQDLFMCLSLRYIYYCRTYLFCLSLLSIIIMLKMHVSHGLKLLKEFVHDPVSMCH